MENILPSERQDFFTEIERAQKFYEDLQTLYELAGAKSEPQYEDYSDRNFSHSLQITFAS